MADKKITIKSSDMERLRELMRREEEKFDAANPSDTELEELEAELEDSIRRLAKKIPGNLPSVDQEMERNWSALQQKLKAEPASPKVADVVPLSSKKTNKALPWIGLALAAALVMIMVRPSGPQDEVMDSSRVAMKNTGGALAKADCEVGPLGSAVERMTDGMGFNGPAGALMQLDIRCDEPGFVHARFTGPDAPAPFSFEVPGGKRPLPFLQEGKDPRITLQSKGGWVMSLVLADRDFGKDPVPDDHVLWKDPEIRLGVR